MSIQNPLTPGEIQILQALQKPVTKEEKASVALAQPLLKSYTELKEQTGLSDPVMSTYLKDLQKREFIKRDIDTRKYFLTEDKGMIALDIVDIAGHLNALTNKLHLLSKEKLQKWGEILRGFKSELRARRLVEELS